MQSNGGMGYTYQAQNGGGGAYYPPNNHQAGYPAVYYHVTPQVGNQAYADAGFSKLGDLFGQIKGAGFDRSNYASFSTQLAGLQGYQLPLPSPHQGTGMAGYAPVHHQPEGRDGVYGPTAQYAHNMPSFPNVRTKADWLALDEGLSEMTQAAYEASRPMPTHGQQPEVYHLVSGRVIGDHGPHSAGHIPTSHHDSISASSAHAADSPTPALTPGSSAMSYTSGHSPTSSHSQTVSPSTSGTMYPSLPGVNAMSQSITGPVPVLGEQFTEDHRHRRSGGTLYRAQPSTEEQLRSVDETEAATSSKPKSSKPRRDSNIDPALAGSVSGSSTSPSEGTATPGRETGEADEAWVENMRILEALRAYVKGVIERQEFEAEAEAEGEAPSSQNETTKQEDGDEMEVDSEVKAEEQSLYPKLNV